MKAFWFLLSLTLLFHTLAFSQVKYSGQVLSENGSPIEFANVILLAKDSSFLAGGGTNEYGNYSFEYGGGESNKPLARFIKISSIGYKTLLELLSQQRQEGALFRLNSSVKELQDVTIIGKRRAFTFTNGTFMANVSTIPSLKNSGSLDDLLNKIPFVQGSGSSFSVLGTGETQPCTLMVSSYKM